MAKKYPALLLSALCVTGCGLVERDKASDARKLTTVFPVLEQHRVLAFRNHDWCKAFESDRGTFATDMRGTCTYLLQSQPQQLDVTQEAAFRAVRSALRKTGTGVRIVKDIEYANGKLAQATFDLSAGFSRRRFVYDPGYELPEDLPGELLHTAVDTDWYYVIEDWN